MMDTVTIIAPSKINAFLGVTGKRPDGYHQLETLFLPLKNPADSLRIGPSERLQIRADADIPLDGHNLCWKAVEAFCRAVPDANPNWLIEIEKQIPIAGGMGGGSSDAAAVLSLLNRLHNTPLTFEKLSEIAKSLGADVPFFLNPVPAFATGIGHQITPLKGIPEHFTIPLVLAFSGFPIDAAWSYAHRCGGFSPSGIGQPLIRALQAGDLSETAKHVKNDLSPAVFEKFPLLAIIRSSLNNAGALAAELSGSGPTIFGIMKSHHDAEAAAAILNREFQNGVRFITSLISFTD